MTSAPGVESLAEDQQSISTHRKPSLDSAEFGPQAAGARALFELAILASALAVSDPVQMTKAAQADLAQASISIRDVEHCAAKATRWEPKYDALSARQFAEQDRIEGLLGSGVEPSTVTLMAAEPKLAPHCSDDFVEAASLRAEAAFLEVERLAKRLESATAKGLWLGLFPLCTSTVRSAQLVASPDTGAPAAQIELWPKSAEEFAAYSGRFVSNSGLASRMSVRLEGRVITRPSVYEPIRSALTLTGQSALETEAVVAAANQTCAVP